MVESDARTAFKQEFQKVVDKSENYCKNLSSNICESFANSRTKYTDKRLNQRIQFQLGCMMAALSQCFRKDKDFKWKKMLLQTLDIESSKHMIENFEKEIQQKFKHMERYILFLCSKFNC